MIPFVIKMMVFKTMLQSIEKKRKFAKVRKNEETKGLFHKK